MISEEETRRATQEWKIYLMLIWIEQRCRALHRDPEFMKRFDEWEAKKKSTEPVSSEQCMK